jgi:CRP/FNR family transcriptional regulator, cyclic AMP receptor protein
MSLAVSVIPRERGGGVGEKKRFTAIEEASVGWAGVRGHRRECESGDAIFQQGHPADTVIYLERGAVRLTVASHAGKEVVVGVLESGQFFGEGCVAGQSQRMATATAIARSALIAVEKQELVRQLHDRPAFAEVFFTHMLTGNIRVEEELIDQLFNSTEKRLARTLLLLARYGEPNASQRALPRISLELLAEMVGTTRARVDLFMNRFRKLGFIDYNGVLKINDSLLSVVLHDQ